MELGMRMECHWGLQREWGQLWRPGRLAPGRRYPIEEPLPLSPRSSPLTMSRRDATDQQAPEADRVEVPGQSRPRFATTASPLAPRQAIQRNPRWLRSEMQDEKARTSCRHPSSGLAE